MKNNEPVPILDLSTEINELWDEYNSAIQAVLRSSQFINGPETRAFEAEAADYLGVKHAIGVNSGTDALVIALRALGIGAGDEVITTPFSFFATAESISNVGAKPVFVDVEEHSFNIDPKEILKAINDKTKAIMPVHLYGRPANMASIMAIAQEHDLKVIEDAAQSFGAKYFDKESRYHNRFTGAIGDINAFSFYPTKNLGAFGDAGLVTTNSDELAEQALKLRSHGELKRYQNEMFGYNSRLDSLQAAILRIKLRHVDGWNAKRREVAKYYNQLLMNSSSLICPEITDSHIFHQYTIRLIKADREQIKDKLASSGISTMIYYPIPQDRLEPYQGQYGNFIHSNRLAQEVLSLPIWPDISKSQQERVTSAILEFLN